MSHRWLLTAVVCFLAVMQRSVSGGEMRATLGMEFDDNPFEQDESRRAGWVSRLYLSADSRLLERNRGYLRLRHQWGVKRFWRGERRAAESGDVVASQLDLSGMLHLNERFSLLGGSDLKIKNVQRISSDESYLRGGLRLGAVGQWRQRFSAVIDYRRGEDDARDVRLVDLDQHEIGCDLYYTHSRRLRGQLGFNWRRLGFARPSLGVDADGQIVEKKEEQEDRRREVNFGVQYFRGVLVQANYAAIDNRSNSVGYGFSAQRAQLMLTRHLWRGIDGQLFLSTQRRRYDEEGESPLPEEVGEQDEYEQTLFSVKVARQMNERFDLSWQYRYARSGRRGEEAYFRKNVYSFAVDMGI